LANGNKKMNRRKWQAAPLMGWDVVCVFSNKRILVIGAGAGKGFSASEAHAFFCPYANEVTK
jgi:hypothetical protein